MKRIYYIFILLFAAFAVSCSKDMPESGLGMDTDEGVATLTFSVPGVATRAVAEYDLWEYCDVRFYKYDDASKESKSLIRHYYEIDEIPESIWLLEGDYCVTVSLGDRESGVLATFDRPIYFGSTDFEIEAGKTTAVNVDCRIQNTIIKVVFDKSIIDKFDREDTDDVLGLTYKYRATIAVRDSWSTNDVTGNKVPYLHYIDSEVTADADGNAYRAGYFVLPAGAEKISYCFNGFSNDDELVGNDPNSSNNEIMRELHTHRSGKELTLPAGADTREGVMYTMTFNYSPDSPGYIGVDFTVTVADLVEIDDIVKVDPSPKPAIDGFEWSIDEEHAVEGDELVYNITYNEAALTEVKMYVDKEVEPRTINLAQNSSAGGISVDVQQSGHLAVLTLGSEFLNTLTGGQHKLEFHISAANQKDGSATSTIRMQGLVSVAHKAWYGVAVADAVIFADSKSRAKIQYRDKSTDSWSDYTPSSSASEDIYTENIGGMGAENHGKTFEFRLTVDGQQVGKSMEITTEDFVPQVPNSGFETWSGSSPLLPYISGGEQFWDTGNHGSRLANVNVTTNETNNPHAGTYCAKLNSQKATVLGIGKFAAGNIFVGEYAGTNGMNGSIGFGKQFGYTYKPKAIRFWYRGTVGSIDERDDKAPSNVQKGDSDVAQFYCMVCKTEGPHIVDTRDANTFMNFESKTISYCSALNGAKSVNDREGGLVIGVGTWEKTQTQITKTNGEGGYSTESTSATLDGWTMMEMPINYNSEYDDELPTYIMITASASKYGDYFTGATSSVMYLDDVEIVY